ncbi:MAG: HAMP domain-containing histidine kinase [Bacteroidaceae bacterium]|nr:HAMP domain-containing histidine kinase [Bacteroidaceae bacterium]
MKLIYKVTIRLSLALLPIMLLWATIFYFSMVNEITDEADDSLEDYAELIVMRTLTGRELPSIGDGTNNTYTIELLPDTTLHTASMTYEDRQVYIPEKRETEPARVLTMVFLDSQDRAYRLTVSTPTFEREDLLESMLLHLILLYVILVITIMTVTALVFNYSMKPLYRLLGWLDGYNLGNGVDDLPMCTHITEFKKLTESARSTIERAEKYYERQKQFIGNASHELQTPLAVLGTRLEWMIDNTQLTEEQFAELTKMRQALHRLSRLNRTLLLISKIENAQFNEKHDVDITEFIENELEIYKEIYAGKEIVCDTALPARFIVSMDESLATTLVTNLIKNAFLHTADNGTIEISLQDGTLTVSNSGEEALDATRLFDRFYTSGKSGSTGLGLALVKSIANCYNFGLRYYFKAGKHCFEVKLRK